MLGRIAPSRGHPETRPRGQSPIERAFVLHASRFARGSRPRRAGNRNPRYQSPRTARTPPRSCEWSRPDGSARRRTVGRRAAARRALDRASSREPICAVCSMPRAAPRRCADAAEAMRCASIRPRSTCTASRRWLGAVARCSTTTLDHAANVLARALDEWRGPALQDLRHVPLLHLEGIRLDELRLATIEARMAAELATGGHVMAVSALQRLVEEHPYREHLRALLMLALYRSGRQVEALRTYQGARVALAEVGVEPGPELRELDEWISCDDPRLRAPVASSTDRCRRTSVPRGRRRRGRRSVGRVRDLRG